MTTPPATTRQLSIDSSKCQGHGRCYSLAPELFDADDEGYAIVLVSDVPPEQQALADQTAAECPEQAISLSGAPR